MKSESAYKVIVDHLRCVSFLIADGVMPSNEGRGYVLRRIMRRAMRFCYQLGAKEALMHKLVDDLIEQMGGSYGELKRARELIIDILKNEEEKFRGNLASGLKLLDEELAKVEKGQVLGGKEAFILYDTYGFPLDLTCDILKEKGFGVDLKGFDEQMALQKKRAKENWQGSGSKADEGVYFELLEKFGASVSCFYDYLQKDTEILAIVKNGQLVDEICERKDGDVVEVVFANTPFYATAGGQKGDNGFIYKDVSRDEFLKVVTTDKKAKELFVHRVSKVVGEFKVGNKISAVVDGKNRVLRSKGHSATHLLHFALKQVLGSHVSQKGSIIDVESFTFDFNHPKSLGGDQIKKIEDLVNYYVWQNSEVKAEVLPISQAHKKGAQALFGEKYGDEVRVLSMGIGVDQKAASIEFCGGIHVRKLGEIGLFKIISEGAIASGVRRIEARVGKFAFDYLRRCDDALSEIREDFKVKLAKDDFDGLGRSIKGKVKLLKDQEKEIARLNKIGLMAKIEQVVAKKIGDINFIGEIFDGIEAKDLREIALNLKQKNNENCLIVLLSRNNGKVALLLAQSKDLVDRFGLVEFIGKYGGLIGAKGGGGAKDLVMSGGDKVAGVGDFIAGVEDFVCGDLAID